MGWMVPGGGIEPPQAFWALRILSPLRLPISPSRHGTTPGISAGERTRYREISWNAGFNVPRYGAAYHGELYGDAR